MALINFHAFSKTLGMQMTFDVILPEPSQGIGVTGSKGWDGKSKLPVLYLLHGMSDDHSIWGRRTSVERYASDKAIAIVMPTTHLAFYTNQAYGLPYYDYIAHELPELCETYFPISGKREDRFIAGLSMGGYGALKIGLRERHRFSAIAAYSSGLLRADRLPAEAANYTEIASLYADREKLDPDVYKSLMHFYSTFGSPEAYRSSSEDNVEQIARDAAASGDELPALRVQCGTEDFLFEANEAFHKLLNELNIEHEYLTESGSHEWHLWDKWIGQTLEWLPL